MTAPEKTVEQLQAELEAAQAEYAKLVARIPRVAGRLARENNLCSVVNRAIDSLNLPVPERPEAAEFTMTITVKGKYHAARGTTDWTSVNFQSEQLERDLLARENNGLPAQLTFADDYRNFLRDKISATDRREAFGRIASLPGYTLQDLSVEVEQSLTPSTRTRRAPAKKAPAKKAARKRAAS